MGPDSLQPGHCGYNLRSLLQQPAPDSLGQIIVVQSTAAVSEPATCAMMLIGFGAFGFVMRRRGKVLTGICFV